MFLSDASKLNTPDIRMGWLHAEFNVLGWIGHRSVSTPGKRANRKSENGPILNVRLADLPGLRLDFVELVLPSPIIRDR
jgi:hypothetical protein